MAAAVGDWRLVGQEAALSSLTCRRLYARHGKSDDLVLVCVQGSFYAMEAWCSHMGECRCVHIWVSIVTVTYVHLCVYIWASVALFPY